MKKMILISLVVAMFCIFTAPAVFAGGDKVRGEKGQGEVHQMQVQDPPPFQP